MVLNRLLKDRRKNKKDLQGGAGLLKQKITNNHKKIVQISTDKFNRNYLSIIWLCLFNNNLKKIKNV